MADNRDSKRERCLPLCLPFFYIISIIFRPPQLFSIYIQLQFIVFENDNNNNNKKNVFVHPGLKVKTFTSPVVTDKEKIQIVRPVLQFLRWMLTFRNAQYSLVKFFSLETFMDQHRLKPCQAIRFRCCAYYPPKPGLQHRKSFDRQACYFFGILMEHFLVHIDQTINYFYLILQKKFKKKHSLWSGNNFLKFKHLHMHS